MKILVDENIPLARELFGALGEVVLAAGRDVDENMPGLETFDALAIRSVTKVTPALIDRAVRARFIGTATIGTDHIDTAYIEQANAGREAPVTVVSAPGSNADSVADYVFYVLAHMTGRQEKSLTGRSLGIIGHGNCGSRVAKRAAGFGMQVLACDPPLAERDPAFTSAAFEDAIAADFVTCHVPLTKKGETPYPTYHMIGQAELACMKPGGLPDQQLARGGGGLGGAGGRAAGGRHRRRAGRLRGRAGADAGTDPADGRWPRRT